MCKRVKLLELEDDEPDISTLHVDRLKAVRRTAGHDSIKDPTMALDFSTARIKHTTWKLKLRDYLDGKPGLTPAQATSHKDCDLGKWMYAEGLTKYGGFPEMKTLEREHETLHKTIKTIMDFKTAGKVAEAEAEFLKVEPLSKKIVDLLTAVEAKVQQKKAA